MGLTVPIPTFPDEANVIIIGGGVIGCSIAYHLGKLGWKDILLLERKKLILSPDLLRFQERKTNYSL